MNFQLPQTQHPSAHPYLLLPSSFSTKTRLVLTSFIAVVGFLLSSLSFHASAAVASPSITSPLPLNVVRDFDPPSQNWLPGHRGIDIAAHPGATVLAPVDAKVRWVGQINHIPMISLVHQDGLISTYQPISTSLSKGDQVHAGEVIGQLLAGHEGCNVEACLHWGLKDGDSYLDPLAWINGSRVDQVRLLPSDAKPRQIPLGELANFISSPEGLPVPGPLTSPFGYRINPISGEPEFHDGIDIGADCGTPIAAATDGTIGFAGISGGFGNRIELDQSRGNQTSYSHLSEIFVSAGQSITQGEIIGLVGTTGYSTGCHLHFSVVKDGVTIDPLSVADP